MRLVAALIVSTCVVGAAAAQWSPVAHSSQTTVGSWRLRSVVGAPVASFGMAALRRQDLLLATDEPPELPLAVTVSTAWPNPSHDRVRLELALPSDLFVTVTVFDVLGRRVATPLSESLPAGRHVATWRPNGTPAGAYFVRISAGQVVETRPVVLVR
ncbi:MAG: T9SS type A sorting domain-containing protein [Rhodothermales bacterium]|nr:T9SS type A sorting domain-containing protein [Rhodothermales bacterium]MBO6778535.1 T9SS type A sorting domain-containing protein [Rhodothermales bacterium]